MKKRTPTVSNAVKYVIFTLILLLLFYFIPQPSKHSEEITFEVSRDHQQSPHKMDEVIGNYDQNSAENTKEKSQEQEIVERSSKEDLFDVPSFDETPVSAEKASPESKQPTLANPRLAATQAATAPNNTTSVQPRDSNQPFHDLDKETGLSDTEYFHKFVQIYHDQKLRGVTPESRKDVVIRYYVKEKDEDRVFSLRQLGFYIHERPTSEDYQGFPTNALYYGNEVHIADLKMVAYTLLRKGVELRLIEPSKFSNDWKTRSIEIGAEDSKVDFPLISLGDIRQLSL